MATYDRAPRIRLPDDLSGSLRYLGDTELRRLRDAIAAEIKRRRPALLEEERGRASGSAVKIVQIPEGKANLIRASFKAGLKPGAVARTLGLPLSLVQSVLKSKSG